MPKNIKCSQCKYLQPKFSVVDPDFPAGEDEFSCEADTSLILSKSEISKLRDCHFYKDRVGTIQKTGRYINVKKQRDVLYVILTGLIFFGIGWGTMVLYQNYHQFLNLEGRISLYLLTLGIGGIMYKIFKWGWNKTPED